MKLKSCQKFFYFSSFAGVLKPAFSIQKHRHFLINISLLLWSQIQTYLFGMFAKPTLHMFQCSNGFRSVPKLGNWASRIFWLEGRHFWLTVVLFWNDTKQSRPKQRDLGGGQLGLAVAADKQQNYKAGVFEVKQNHHEIMKEFHLISQSLTFSALFSLNDNFVDQKLNLY